MPIARFQMPDGRVARFEVPEGYSPEQALGEFEAWAAAQPSAEEPAYKNLAKVPKELLGFAEAPIAMGTGIVASAFGGLKGLGKLVTGQGIDAAAKAVEETQGYQPKTGVGQAIVKGVAAPFEFASEGWKQIGQAVAGDEGELVGGLVVPAVSTVAGYRPMVRGAQAGAEAAKTAADIAGKKLQAGGVNLQLTALKPTAKEYRTGDAMFAAEELLKRGITPNAKGIAKIQEKIDALNSEISGKIATSSERVQKQAVLDKLINVRDRFIKQVNPEADLAAIQKVGEGFEAHPLISGGDMPIQLAQAMKQSTYRELRGKYGEEGAAAVEAQKALARGLKEEIAKAIPEVAKLNAEESALLRTLSVAERRAFAELNKDPVPMAGALRSPEMWAAITADKSVAFKSLLARQMYKLGRAMQKEATSAPPTSTSNLPVPYVARGDVNPPEPPNWVPGRGYGPIVQERQPKTTGLLTDEGSDFSRMAKQREEFDLNQMRQTAVEGEVLPNAPDWRPYTPPLLEDTRTPNYPSGASNLPPPMQRKLLVDQDLVNTRQALAQAEAEYAQWAQEAAQRANQARQEMMSARSNTPRVMSDVEKKWDKITKREAARRMEMMQKIRALKDVEAQLIDMQEGMLSPRAGTQPFMGQGPRTRAAQNVGG